MTEERVFKLDEVISSALALGRDPFVKQMLKLEPLPAHLVWSVVWWLVRRVTEDDGPA